MEMWRVETPARLVIVGADALARSALSSILAGAGQVTEAPPGAEAVARISRGSPDAIVWDLGLDGDAGLDVLPRVAGVAPVIALVAREEQALAAWNVGARGVLSRETSSERLLAAVRAARSGLVVHEEGMSAAPLRREGAEPALEPLTPREMEVLQRMIQGVSNRRIAEALGISEHTAKFHVNAILGKLGASTRTEAVVLAVRRGLVML